VNGNNKKSMGGIILGKERLDKYFLSCRREEEKKEK
jgi:hypothetical protein